MDTYKKILAIDPGVSTGIAARNGSNIITAVLKQSEQVYDLFTANRPDIVVCEQFGTTLISKYGLHTVRLIGGIQALCYVYKIVLIQQPPQRRYPYLQEATNLLRATNKKYLIHEVDATAHLLAYIAANK